MEVRYTDVIHVDSYTVSSGNVTDCFPAGGVVGAKGVILASEGTADHNVKVALGYDGTAPTDPTSIGTADATGAVFAMESTAGRNIVIRQDHLPSRKYISHVKMISSTGTDNTWSVTYVR